MRQKCQNKQPRKLTMVPESALNTQSFEHNQLVPRSTIKGNQKYFGPWLFMNQLNFPFQTLKVTESNRVEPKREIPPFRHPAAHPFSPVLLQVGFC